MKVLFSHGKESGPWGFKIKRLAALVRNRGYELDSIDYRGIDDPELRVEKLLNNLVTASEDIILVGSSLGGYVSLIAAEKTNCRAIFLMAPALYMPSLQQQDYYPDCSHIELVHGWQDDVIPPQNSIRFAEQTSSSLHLIEGDHGLRDVIESVESIFSNFLDRAMNINITAP
jgi:predicted esterase